MKSKPKKISAILLLNKLYYLSSHKVVGVFKICINMLKIKEKSKGKRDKEKVYRKKICKFQLLFRTLRVKKYYSNSIFEDILEI